MKVNGTGHAAAAGPSVNAEGAAEEKKEEWFIEWRTRREENAEAGGDEDLWQTR
jgi:hypothetical protein